MPKPQLHYTRVHNPNSNSLIPKRINPRSLYIFNYI